ncbi:MAG TPA: Ig-like domain repeat protein [Solirubrobacteraceae bacterium]|nr:Ig-like domain repeat protein [Solirubrobacteraceae bacterium]
MSVLAAAALACGAAPSIAQAAAGWQVVPAANPVANGIGAGFPVPNGSLSSVSCVSGKCMAVGSSLALISGDTTGQATAESNAGGGWALTPVANPGGVDGDQLSGVSCAAAASCVSVGSQGGGFGQGSVPLAERWDGGDWETMSTPATGDDTFFNGVSCPTVNDCVAVGNQSGAGGAEQLAPATGAYVSPAAGSDISGEQTSSPDGTYSAAWNGNNVTVSDSSGTVLTTQATEGGFSPSGQAFVAETLSGGILDVQLFNLSDGDAATAIFAVDPTVTSATVAFSPSGHYLMVGYTTATQTFFDVADATATSQAAAAVFTSGAIDVSGAPGPCNGKGSCGVASYGFGPNDSRFYYAYISNSGQYVQWRWTDLAKPAPAPIYADQTAGTSGYAKFSPGGAYLAIVTGSGSGTVRVDLFATDGGQDLAAAGPTASAADPVLTATGSEQTATIAGHETDLTANNDAVWTAMTAATPSPPTPPPGVTGNTPDGTELDAVSCVTATDCVAAGEGWWRGTAPGNPTDIYGSPLLEHWDGTSWTVAYVSVGSPLTLESGETGVSCVADAQTATGDACVVVGYGDAASQILTLNQTGGWSSWKQTAGPSQPSGSVYVLSGVSCVSAADCTAAGTYRADGGSNTTFVINGNALGAPWSIEPTPTYDFGSFLSIDGVSCSAAGDCVAVGLGQGAAYAAPGLGSDESAMILAEGQGWQTGVSASPSDATYGSPITYTATLSGPGAPASGEVAFAGNGGLGGQAPLCTARLSHGTASCQATATPGGAGEVYGYLVFATGSGSDASLTAAWTTAVDVTRQPSTISAHTSGGPVPAGTSVTYSATVSVADGRALGGVSFSVGSTQLCAASVLSGSASCTSTGAPVGTDTVTAAYAGDESTAGSSATTTLTVEPGDGATPSATAVTVSPATVTQGRTVTYSATVSGSGGPPTGTVDFSAGGDELCSATLSGGSGSCLSNTAPAGAQTVTASYSGSAAFDPSQGTGSLRVNAATASPRVFVANAGDSTISSYPDSFRGNVTPAGEISGSTGAALDQPASVQLDASGNLWVANCASDSVTDYAAAAVGRSGAVTPAAVIEDDGDGSLACPQALSFDASGDLWVANADGDTVVEYSGSQLAALAATATPTPAVTLSDDPTGVPDGNGTDTISQPDALAFDAAGDLWVGSSASDLVVEFTPAVLSTGAPAATVAREVSGPTTIAFDASGDLWAAEAGSQSVDEYTPAQLASDDYSSPTVVVGNDGYTNDMADPQQIAFDSEGDLWVAADNPAAVSEYTPAQLATSGYPAPAEVISGPKTGLDDPAGIAVEDAAISAGAVQVDEPSVTAGDTVTYSATVSGQGGTPTGTVDFTSGATDLCTATLSAGSGSCTATSAPIGSDTIHGRYSGDGTFAGAHLSPDTLQVMPPPTSVAVTASPDPVDTGHDLALHAAVTGPDGSGAPTGTVDFTIGSTELCSADLDADGTAGCVAAAPAATGEVTVTASYSGDPAFAASHGTASVSVEAASGFGPDIIVANQWNSTLTSYPLDATADAIPDTTVSADDADALSQPAAMALDGAGDLWVATCAGEIIEYSPDQLVETGTPAPVVILTGSFDCPQALSFDGDGDLWIADTYDDRLLEYTPGQLTSSGAPTPATIIGDDGGGDLDAPAGLAFDGAGDLWVSSSANDGSVLGYTPQQLAGGGSPTPATTIVDDGSGDLSQPSQLAFDSSGDLWVSSSASSMLLEYAPQQLAGGGAATASTTIADDGNGDLADPQQLAFDSAGDLWVASIDAGSVLEYTPVQLGGSGTPVPHAMIDGDLTGLDGPSGLVIQTGPQGAATVPGVPLDLHADAGNGQVSLSWTAPTSDGGASITGYRVLRADSATGSFSAVAAPTASPYLDTGLTAGASYYYELEAVNSVGDSPPTSAITVTLPARPSAPTAVSASAGVGAATVSWAAPDSDGGSAISGYAVTSSDLTTGTDSAPYVATADQSAHTFTGLAPGDEYRFSVAATNTAGLAGPAAGSNAVVPVDAGASAGDSGSSSSPSGIAGASLGSSGAPGSISATAAGEGTLDVATYAADPLAGLAAGDSWFDVSTAPGSSFDSVTFTICGVPDGDDVQWWNPVARALQPASRQAAASGGCITVTVDATSSPSLAELYGTLFTELSTGGSGGGGGTQTGGGGAGGSGGGAAPPGGGSPVTPAGADAKPKLGRVSISGTAARVALSCAGQVGASCRLKLVLSVRETIRDGKIIAVAATAGHVRRTKTASRTVTLATAGVTIVAGRAKTVTLRLGGAGRRLLTTRRRLKVKLAVTRYGAGEPVTIAGKVLSFTAQPSRHKAAD